jgi:glycosyltransferase involved in cell wall biosynthesis
VLHPLTPKRILYVENGIGYGGAVICLRHLVRNLDRQQFQGRIITGRTGPEYQGIAEDAEWRFISDRRINVVRLRRCLSESKWIVKLPGLAWFLNQAIARLDDIVNFLPFCIGLFEEIRKFKPDLIHANNEPLCNRAALILGYLMGIPIICHVRGPQTGSWMMRRLYRLPDYFISVSYWIDREIGTIGVPVSKRTVVYDGIELDKLNPIQNTETFRATFGIKKDTFAVGLVGLLIPWKGQQLFIDVAEYLRDRIVGLKMFIIGGTPNDCLEYEAHLREMVLRKRLEDTVIFTGHIGNMVPVYSDLDIVVSASTRPEPLGTMVIETMAMGRPLVAPAHGGGAEMNTHGETALLFRPGDAVALAESIIQLYHFPELGKKLGAAARIRALKTFEIGKHVSEVQKIYAHVLG